MGGLYGKMTASFWAYLMGTLALVGIPPLAGFWSKDEILAEAFMHGFGEHAGPLRPVLDGLLNHDPTTRLRPVRARRMLLAVARGTNGVVTSVGQPVTAVSRMRRRRTGALTPG